MKIVGFVEGAQRNSPGIVGVPKILQSAAGQGHSIVLLMAGPPSLGSEKYATPNVECALSRKEGRGTFGVVCLRAWTRWMFSPAILWRFRQLVKDADLVTLHSLYSFPVLAGYLFARLYRKPYAFWPHGVLAPFQRGVSSRKKWLYHRLFANSILQNASIIFYSAEGERNETEALRLRPTSVIAAEGFDADEFNQLPKRGSFRSRFLNGHDGPVVLFLARVNAKKGLDLLIRAMQTVISERPDTRLAIVGPSDPAPFKKQVMDWVRESGIESNTVLTGAADSRMRLEAFADADLYVLPSHAENFGFTVFEAMACGIPVVVSETLNFAEDFVRGGAGLALPRNPEDFAAAILNLINAPELRSQMGACGRALARKYSWNETGAKVASALDSVLKNQPCPAELVPRGWLRHTEDRASVVRRK